MSRRDLYRLDAVEEDAVESLLVGLEQMYLIWDGEELEGGGYNTTTGDGKYCSPVSQGYPLF